MRKFVKDSQKNPPFWPLMLLVLLACETPQPQQGSGLAMTEFAELYAQAVILHHSKDSLRAIQKVDSMLAARGVSHEMMEFAVAEYQQDQEQWQHFWTLVVKNLEAAANPLAREDSVIVDEKEGTTR